MSTDDESGLAAQFAFSEDVAATDWLRQRVVDGGVGWSVIPAGFDAYVQVLHPARDPDESGIRWREIADWAGLPLLPGVWFQDLADLAPADRPLRPWVQKPSLWEIPDAALNAMTPILAGHTTTSDGWFGLREGSGLDGGSVLSVAWPVDHPPPGTPSRYRSWSTLPHAVLKGSSCGSPIGNICFSPGR